MIRDATQVGCRIDDLCVVTSKFMGYFRHVVDLSTQAGLSPRSRQLAASLLVLAGACWCLLCKAGPSKRQQAGGYSWESVVLFC